MNSKLSTNRIFAIRPAHQDYSWGMHGDCSVARLTHAELEGISGPHAEAWFGAHKNGPAVGSGGTIDGRRLGALVEENPDGILGRSRPLFNGVFPFMGKVLCIREPLSIQLHPKVIDAIRLHQARPEHYPDAFPKDEASVAITDVELLYGMKSLDEMIRSIEPLPLLPQIIGEALAAAKSSTETPAEAARALFAAIWNLDPKQVQRACLAIFESIEEKDSSERSEAEEWTLRMKEYYPEGDVGIFGFSVMELLKLKPGQSVSIACGTPHAYLSGELFELMKPSDNVIRCGLTPKYRDDEELVRCANFEPIVAPIIDGRLRQFEKGSYREYDLGGNFFIDTFEGAGLTELSSFDSPQILLSLDAAGTITSKHDDTELHFEPTNAFVVPACVNDYTLELTSGRLSRFRLPH